ncbi:hypothetical protein [Anoxynatronum sibiricum]|uniref:Uncharacterized protein n=1 Tax=Anoxynatronum sibiricum TaxID=210623 RepID=A0ABU9VSF6_9CLOT
MRKRRGLSGLLLIFMILLMISPWAIRWIQRTWLSPALLLKPVREVAIPYSGNLAVHPGGEGLYLVRHAEVRYFHPQQDQDWAFGTETLVPVTGNNENHLFLMEASPRYLLRINEQGHMLYQQAANRNADSIFACDAGFLLLQHPEENRLLPFSVLDSDGRVMGNMLLTEGVVLHASISGRHERVLISVLRRAGNTFETALLMYDLHGVLQSSQNLQGKVVADHLITEEGDVVVLTTESLHRYTLTMEERWQTPVEPFYLTARDKTGHWALAHRAEIMGDIANETVNGNSEADPPETIITFIDWEAEKVTFFEESAAIHELKVNDRFLLMGQQRRLAVLNHDGELLDEKSYQDDVEELFLLPGQRVAVLRRGQIHFYQLQTGD